MTSVYPVDEDKIIVYGQNYGGYLGLKMMEMLGRGERFFSCAILRSPVLDWQHYGDLSYNPTGATQLTFYRSV